MGILVRAKSSISGLVADLSTLTQAIANEATARDTSDGSLASLETTEKTNLVGAINEVKGTADSAATAGAGSLQKTANLTDVSDVAVARTSLEVMSATEVASAISAAKLDLGTNFTVASIEARDLLTNLDTADRVMVSDDGDGKWAMYTPTTVDEFGAAEGWIKMSDQDALENAISSASIKAAYELNDDTNAYTDADAAKVGFVTVTKAVDLDDVVLKADLAQTVGAGAEDVVASTAGVKAYVDSQMSAAGATPVLEGVVVAGSLITLTHAPKGGINGVMNFGTVRFVDEGSIAYDAPLVATGEPKEFTVSTDTLDQWTGKTVQVQYLYVTE